MHDSDLEDLATKAAGNFLSWENYSSGLTDDPKRKDSSYYEYVPDLDNWTIEYVDRGSQSTLVDESNAAYIKEALTPFMDGEDPDVVEYNARHWAVGSLSGYRIRVRKGGEITQAFRVWAEIKEALDRYPILNETDHSEREFDATVDNIKSIGRRWVADNAPSSWPGDVEYWLAHNGYETELESRSDQGGYPSDESVRAALTALGYIDELHGLAHGSAAYGRMVKRIRAAAKREYEHDRFYTELHALRVPKWKTCWTAKAGHKSYAVPPEKLRERTLKKRARRTAAEAARNHFRYEW